MDNNPGHPGINMSLYPKNNLKTEKWDIQKASKWTKR
jgi:hypothetical protein